MTEQFGYCTNVHLGKDFEEYLEQLTLHSVAVKDFLDVDAQKIGLWFSNQTASQLTGHDNYQHLITLLNDQQLHAFTLNGFPYGNFHESVVKHRVYQPTWAENSRLNYTQTLAELLSRLLADQGRFDEGSISTLPLGWPNDSLDERWFARCADQLRAMAIFLESLERTTGKWIRIAIEPEPGCVFSVSQDLCDFFDRWLITGNIEQDSLIRRYLGVCHDVCHAAVMFESQGAALDRYQHHEIEIFKIQVSSALVARFPGEAGEGHAKRLHELASFAEDRYLHQTCIKHLESSATHFFEDLPLGLEHVEEQKNAVEARVHFHVPIFCNSLGSLLTTQGEIMECLKWFVGKSAKPDIEVETYAWNVLPKQYQVNSLAEGIANEIRWLAEIDPGKFAD